MTSPKPSRPPRPGAPTGRPPGAKVTPLAQVKARSDGPVYEEIPAGKFEVVESGKPARDSINLIKRDIVNRRTQMFEKGEGLTAGNDHEGSPPSRDQSCDTSRDSGEKPEPPPVETIPPKPSARGERAAPRRPPVPRMHSKPLATGGKTKPEPEVSKRPVTMTMDAPSKPEPAARPVSVMTKPGVGFPPKPSPISPKPRLSPGAGSSKEGSPETPTPTADAPDSVVSVRDLKDRFSDKDDQQISPPQTKPTMRLKTQFEVAQNGGTSEGQDTAAPQPAATYSKVVKPKRDKPDVTLAKPQRSQLPQAAEEEVYSKPPVPVKNFDVSEFQASHGAESKPPRVPQGYDGVILLQGEDGEVRPQLQEKPALSPKPQGEGAPKKPPRTFAHDKYIIAKNERKTRRSSSPGQGRGQGEKDTPQGQDRERARSPKLRAKSALVIAPPGVGERPEPIAEGDEHSHGKGGKPKHDSAGGVSSNSADTLGDGYTQVDTLKRRPPRPPLPSTGDTSPRPVSGEIPPSRWDQGVVRVKEHNQSLAKEYFVPKGRGRMINPSYEQHDDFLPLDTTTPASPGHEGHEGLKRTKSDECLYSEPVVRGVVLDGPHGNVIGSDSSYDEMGDPIYHDPADVITAGAQAQKGAHVTQHGVHVDEEGYAVPVVQRQKYDRQMSSPASRRKAVRRSGTMAAADHREPRPGRRLPGGGVVEAIQLQRKRSSVRDKVSRAYSVLRPRRQAQEPAAEGCIQGLAEEDDSDTEIDMEEHKKRLKYVGSVRERTYMAVNHYGRLQAQPKNPIFSLGLLVGLEKVEDTNKYKPKILSQFPTQVTDDLKSIAEFCFPDASVWRPVTHYNSEMFSFVLTNEDGSRKNGYCRRVLPPGQGNRLPEVYCVISPLHAWNFYTNFLCEVEKRRNLSIEHAQDMLRAAHSKSLPRPGQEAWLWCLGNASGKESVILKRSSNPTVDDVSFEPLLSHLSTDVLLKVFASILLERRIIFTAQHLSTLTSCIHGISSLLYPFQWQHTYVPVLPGSMLDFLCAPTPYIMGVLTSAQPHLQDLALEEILLVDLDNNNLLRSQGDEGRLIPKKLQKALTAALKEDSDGTGSQDMIVSEAFLRLFVETCSHYTEYICTQQDGKKVFERDSFVKAVTSKSIRMFLEWFSETQMFEVFIRERTESLATPGLFETRVVEYRDEMEEMGLSLKENVKQVGRKIASFFLESGDKIKKKLSSGSVYV